MTPDPNPNLPQWSRSLEAGIDAMALVVSASQRSRLLAYLALLEKWNRAFNLTAIRDPAQMVPRQLLDSLSLLPHLPTGRVLDVGTGGGLPGIPLAIARPQAAFVLLDANGKKIRFVRQAVLELGLANVEPVHGRVERYRPAQPFDVVVSRAFASLGDMVDATRHLLAPHGCWIAMKGPGETAERQALPAGLAVASVPVVIPGLPADHRLAIIRTA